MHSSSKLPLPELATLLERAQASQNMAYARALAAHDPKSGAEVLELPGAIAVFFGGGHPLNQALALGLGAPLDDAGLAAIEALLARGGHPVVVELTPGADPDLARRLAKRGYFVRQFQQVWMRAIDAPIDAAPPPAPFAARAARPDEVDLFARLVMAGFMETDELPTGDALVLPPLAAEGTTPFLAFHGDRPVAGGTVGLCGAVAALSGTAVLPSFRGHGLQRALIEARLAFAARHGARVATSATLPLTASADNLSRVGFRAAYPKLELANG